ncbi:MAG: hypothetical protein OEV42_05715 [Deltaproteobacteria bacterium]|nr:hypothetical protein [Deltaproteobacteria bacterium]
MGFKFLSFVFAYLAAGAFSRFPQLEPSSLLIQGMALCYILGGFTLSFALWTKKGWVLYSFIFWSLLSIAFMFVLQQGQLRMSWSEFAASLATIVLIQFLLGLYIKRSMALEKGMEDTLKD